MTGTDPAPAGLTLANWDLGGEPSAWAYLHAGDLFPHVEIPPVRPVARLPVAESGEVAKFAVEAGLTLDEYVGTAPVSGIVIVHRGRTAYERYPRMRPEDRHLLMSVTKLFPAVLVGILERRGMVDLGQPVDAVIGELAGAGWAGVPIGDILSMASGTDCLEVDDPAAYTDPDHPFSRFEASLGWRPARGAAPSTYDLVAALPARRPPGEAYEYTSVNTFVLSWLVERLTGLGFAEVVATGRSGAGLSRWGLRRLPGRRLVALLARLDRPIPDLGQRLLLDHGRHGWWYAIGDGTATTLGYCTTAGSCPLAPAGSRPPGRRPAGPPATGCPTLPGALRCGYARPPPARPTGPGPRAVHETGTNELALAQPPADGRGRQALRGGHARRGGRGCRTEPRLERPRAQDSAAEHSLDEPGVHDEPVAGLPPSAADPPRLAEPQRLLAVRRYRIAGQPTRRPEPPRDRSRAVPDRVRPVRHHAAREHDVVPAHVHCPKWMVRSAGPAQLRRGDLAGHRLGQRPECRYAQRRLRLALLRRHRRAHHRYPRAHRWRVLPGRRGRHPAGQAAAEPERHLLHRRLRHLADRLAGTDERRAHHPAGHHTRRAGRRAEPRRPGRGHLRPGRTGDRLQRRHDRGHRDRHGRRDDPHPDPERPSVEPRRPVPVRPAGNPHRHRRR